MGIWETSKTTYRKCSFVCEVDEVSSVSGNCFQAV